LEPYTIRKKIYRNFYMPFGDRREGHCSFARSGAYLRQAPKRMAYVVNRDDLLDAIENHRIGGAICGLERISLLPEGSWSIDSRRLSP
jgi:hypothetical protein